MVNERMIYILDDLIKELNELKDYKNKYEHAMADKKRMAKELYDLMLNEYKSIPKEVHRDNHIEHWCRCCRGKYGCNKSYMPENVGEPVESEDWIPGTVGCPEFEWD